MAVDSFDPLDRSRRRAQYTDGARSKRVEEIPDFARQRCGPSGLSIGDHHSRQSGEGRVEHRFTVTGFPRIEVLETLRDCELKRVVIRKVTLDDDLPRLIAAAGPA